MSIKMDEDEKNVEMGIGMKFNSIGELKNIQDKIKKAQSLNNQSGRIDAMKNDSPLSKFTGNESEKVAYNYNESGFTRVTTVPEPTEEEAKEMETLFSESNDADNEFIQYFEESYYTVKLVFPKPIKSINIENAVISNDGKTITYKTNWIDYIKNPKPLDIAVKFYE